MSRWFFANRTKLIANASWPSILVLNTVCARWPQFDYDRFLLTLPYALHFSSPATIGFRNGSILLRFNSASQMEIRFMVSFFAWTRVAPIHRAFFIFSFMWMAPNGFLKYVEVLGCQKNAYGRTRQYIIHYLIDLFDNWPSEAWCIFEIKIIRMKPN